MAAAYRRMYILQFLHYLKNYQIIYACLQKSHMYKDIIIFTRMACMSLTLEAFACRLMLHSRQKRDV